MELSEVKTILSGTGLPVAYRAWPDDPANNLPPPLPWIVYLETGSQNFSADGVVYLAIKSIRIELYTKEKDPTSERKVETALSNAGIFWNKTEEYLDDEQCYEIIYEIEV